MPVDPVTDFDGRFSEPGAHPIPWADARRVLAEAEIFWLSTVRRDGRPHVTPLLALWQDGALHFSTGPEEQKARNLRHNRRCVLTTGCNAYTASMWWSRARPRGSLTPHGCNGSPTPD